MSKYTATLEIRGKIGGASKLVLPGVGTVGDAMAFWTSIQSAYCEGDCVSTSVSETQKHAVTVEGGNTDRRAIITYQDNDTSTTRRISIPTWGSDAGDRMETPEGERVPLVACQSVITALEQASGRSLTAISGYIIQRK